MGEKTHDRHPPLRGLLAASATKTNGLPRGKRQAVKSARWLGVSVYEVHGRPGKKKKKTKNKKKKRNKRGRYWLQGLSSSAESAGYFTVPGPMALDEETNEGRCCSTWRPPWRRVVDGPQGNSTIASFGEDVSRVRQESWA